MPIFARVNVIIFSTCRPFWTITENKITDSELIRLYLKTQKQDYFNLLYRRYSGKVYSKCISLLKDEGLAQDAAQEVYGKDLP
jgi:hypothetical protein